MASSASYGDAGALLVERELGGFDARLFGIYASLEHPGLARVAEARLGPGGRLTLALEVDEDEPPDAALLLGALAFLHACGLGYLGRLDETALCGARLGPSEALLGGPASLSPLRLADAARLAPELTSERAGASADVYALARLSACADLLPRALVERMTAFDPAARPDARAALLAWLDHSGLGRRAAAPGYRLLGRERERGVLRSWLGRAERGECVVGRVTGEVGSGLSRLVGELALEAGLRGFAAGLEAGAVREGPAAGRAKRHARPAQDRLVLGRTYASLESGARGALVIELGGTADPAAADVLQLARLAPHALAAAVFIPGLEAPEVAALGEQAAARAEGLPELFWELVLEALGRAPRPFGALALERLRHLEQPARRAVELAALCPEPLHAARIAAVGLVSVADVEQALAAGLLRRTGVSVEVVHARLAELVVSRMRPGGLVSAARRLAEELGAGGGEARSVARLWLRAAQPKRALQAALASARGEEGARDPLALRSLLAEVEQAFGARPPLQLLEQRARLAVSLGRPAEAAALLERALDRRRPSGQSLARVACLWNEAGNAVRALAVVGRAGADDAEPGLAVVQAEALFRVGRAAEARSLLDAVLARAEPGSALEAEAASVLAMLIGRGEGATRPALALLERALAIDQALGRLDRVSRTLSRTAIIHQREGRLGAAERAHLGALEAARQAGDQPGEAECRVDVGTLLFELGEASRARTHFEEARAIFLALGDERAVTLGEANLAAVDLMLGHVRDAESTLLACLESDLERGLDGHVAFDEKFLARAALVRGDLGLARERARRAERLFRARGDAVEVGESLEVLALIELKAGASAKAERSAAAGLRELAPFGPTRLKHRLALLHARAVLEARGAGAAEPLLAALVRQEGLGGERLRLEGRIRWSAGDRAEGQRCYERAMELLEAAGNPGERFEAYLEYLELFGAGIEAPRRACVLARLARLAQLLGREAELGERALIAPRPPRSHGELARDGLVALASALRDGPSSDAVLALLGDSVAYSAAALVADAGDGPRVVASRPAGPRPAALDAATRALLTGALVTEPTALAAPGPGVALWVERCDRPFEPEERAFVAALALLLGPPAAELAARSVAAAPSAFVGQSPTLLAALELVRQVAPYPVAVFIGGESGTGKELAARELHALSGRRGELVALDCAALPEALFESELFGHARGAFSGATSDRAGLFEKADQGTLFLDEVGELSAIGQAKLLRALDSGEVRRVGEDRARRVDVRVVSATNRDLEEAVRRGGFRADLLYRLVQVAVELPPLRARAGDVALLVRHFARRAASELNVAELVFDAGALARLEAHDWPGNVRQLQGVVRALAVSTAGRRVELADLPGALRGPAPQQEGLAAARADSDKEAIRRALERTGGNRTQAARILGVARQTLVKRIRSLDLAGEV